MKTQLIPLLHSTFQGSLISIGWVAKLSLNEDNVQFFLEIIGEINQISAVIDEWQETSFVHWTDTFTWNGAKWKKKIDQAMDLAKMQCITISYIFCFTFIPVLISVLWQHKHTREFYPLIGFYIEFIPSMKTFISITWNVRCQHGPLSLKDPMDFQCFEILNENILHRISIRVSRLVVIKHLELTF